MNPSKLTSIENVFDIKIDTDTKSLSADIDCFTQYGNGSCSVIHVEDKIIDKQDHLYLVEGSRILRDLGSFDPHKLETHFGWETKIKCPEVHVIKELCERNNIDWKSVPSLNKC